MDPPLAGGEHTRPWYARVWKILPWLIVVAVVAERARAIAKAEPTDFDDAYMYLRYAHNLLRGHGISWNPGTPVYGATSLLHLIVVTAVGRLEWASAGAALLSILALAALAARFGRGPRWAWVAAVPLLVAYTEPFWFHATSGMDTMLAVLANTGLAAATLVLLERPTPRTAVLTALVAYLAVLARPDNGLYAFAPALALLRDRKLLVRFLAPLAALLATHALLAWHFLGTPAPLGFYVKQPHAYGGFVGEYTWNPFLFLRVFLVAAAPFAVVAVACGRRAAWVLLAPVVPTFAYLFWTNQIMGHLARFFYPALPFFVAAAVVSLERPRPWRAAVAAGLALSAWPLLGFCARHYEARAATQRLASIPTFATATHLPDVDSWQSAQEMARLAAAAPAGTRFAMSEHGLVAARAPEAIIIDVLGLHDRVFARGFSARELSSRNPELIWMPHPDHTQMIRDILDAPEFWDRYTFYPDAFTFGVAVRKDPPIIRAIFSERCRALHGRSCDDAAASSH
jgi:hypothetical protein